MEISISVVPRASTHHRSTPNRIPTEKLGIVERADIPETPALFQAEISPKVNGLIALPRFFYYYY